MRTINPHALETLRKYREMTQTELAKKMGKGVNQSVISQWEKGNVQPSEEHIKRLSKELGFAKKLLYAKFEASGVISWH